MNKIEFMIGDLYDRDSVKDRNDFYLTEDRSYYINPQQMEITVYCLVAIGDLNL